MAENGLHWIESMQLFLGVWPGEREQSIRPLANYPQRILHQMGYMRKHQAIVEQIQPDVIQHNSLYPCRGPR